MQSYWRDLTSKWDCVGPYAFFAGSNDTGEVAAFFAATFKSFSMAGFDVIAVVCDGVNSNLSFFKDLCGAADRKHITHFRPWFHNHWMNARCFVLTDPTHLFKNIRNALHASRAVPDGSSTTTGKKRKRSRDLKIDGKEITWDHVISVWRADSKNYMNAKKTRMTSDAVLLDSFNKMRVHLAKQV